MADQRPGQAEDRARGADHRARIGGHQCKGQGRGDLADDIDHKHAPRADQNVQFARDGHQRQHVHGQVGQPGMQQAIAGEHHQRLKRIDAVTGPEDRRPEAAQEIRGAAQASQPDQGGQPEGGLDHRAQHHHPDHPTGQGRTRATGADRVGDGAGRLHLSHPP